jgi:hypothetical protein
MQQNGGRVGVAEMREDEIVRLSLRCARLAVIGAPYESVLADGVADIMRTDAGTGVTNWNGSGDDPLAAVQVVVSGAPPFTREQAQAALAVVARHPTFAGADPFRWPTHRVSDVVSLPAFWETDVWRLMHGHGNGRYPGRRFAGTPSVRDCVPRSTSLTARIRCGRHDHPESAS